MLPCSLAPLLPCSLAPLPPCPLITNLNLRPVTQLEQVSIQTLAFDDLHQLRAYCVEGGRGALADIIQAHDVPANL